MALAYVSFYHSTHRPDEMFSSIDAPSNKQLKPCTWYFWDSVGSLHPSFEAQKLSTACGRKRWRLEQPRVVKKVSEQIQRGELFPWNSCDSVDNPMFV